MNHEHIVGPITIRTCEGERAHRLPGHTHAFDHVTFARNGWIAIRENDGDEWVQIASLDYRHEPHPDDWLPFEPSGYWRLIPATVKHEIVVLSERGALDCVFTHRDHAGAISQVPGWDAAAAPL